MLLSACNDDSNSTSSVATGNAISGFVIDDPVANAKVSYTLTDGTFLGSTTTGQNGAFSLPLSAYQAAQVQINGNVLITAEKDGKILRGLSCFDYKGGACQDNSTYVSHYSEAALQVAENTLVDKKEFYKAFLENYKQGNYLPADVSSDPIVPVAQAVQSQFYNVAQPSTQVNGISGILETRTNPNAADITSKLVYNIPTCEKIPTCKRISEITEVNGKTLTFDQKLYYDTYINYIKKVVSNEDDALIKQQIVLSDQVDQQVAIAKRVESFFSDLGFMAGLNKLLDDDPKKRLISALKVMKKDLGAKPKTATSIIIDFTINAALKCYESGSCDKLFKAVGEQGEKEVFSAYILRVAGATFEILKGTAQISQMVTMLKGYFELSDLQEQVARNTLRKCILNAYFEKNYGNIDYVNRVSKNHALLGGWIAGQFFEEEDQFYSIYYKAEAGCNTGVENTDFKNLMSSLDNFSSLDLTAGYVNVATGINEQIRQDIEWIERVVKSNKQDLAKINEKSDQFYLQAFITSPPHLVKVSTAPLDFIGFAKSNAEPLKYEWTINNGESVIVKDTETVKGVTFNKSGIYGATFKVTDKNNKSVQEKVTIYAVNPLQVKINSIQEATVDSVINLGYSIVSGDGIEAIQWKTEPQVEGFNTSALSPEQSNKITFKKAGTYTLTLLAVNFAGDVITDTLQLTVKDKAAVSITPPTLTATAGDQKVDLVWGITEGAEVYYLYRNGEKISVSPLMLTFMSTGNPYPETGLTNGQKYCYRVSVIVKGTESNASNEVCVTPVAKTPTPDTTTGNTQTGTTPPKDNTQTGNTDASAKVSYKVKVVDEMNQPIAGISLRLFTVDAFLAEIVDGGQTTNSEGRATFSLIKGTYSVEASSTDYVSSSIALDSTKEVTLKLSKKNSSTTGNQTTTNPNSGGNSTTGGQQSTTPQLPDGTWLGTWNQNANDGFSALGNVELRNKTTLTVNGGEEGLECLGGQSTFTISDVTTNSNGQINFSGGGISYTITSSTAAKMSGTWSTTSNCLIKSGGWEMYKQ